MNTKSWFLPAAHASLWRILWGLLASLMPLWHATALAQISDDARRDTVSWSVSVQGAARPSGTLTLALHGQVLKGWHVYALKQLPGGPTPLRVALEPNKVATANGEPAGSRPSKAHDLGFDLDTQFYSHAFTVTLPVRLSSPLATGRRLIPLSVRFQTCNGLVCQPPKTVRLSAFIDVAAHG
jgi:hypothetical protein